jgi:ribosomal protein L35AE/L33A
MDVESLAKQLILKGMTEEQQKAVLESIRSTMAKSRELQKQKVGEQAQLVIQALKKIESDIKSRYDEVGNKIEERVASIKDGKDGRNGTNGRDGRAGRDGMPGPMGPKGADGRNGTDGRDGEDGVSVTDAHIDFDGSLIISLSSGRTINVGEVVAPDLAEKIKVITNGGGTSQSVLDTLASLQTQINNLIPSQTGNAGKYLTTDGSTLSWGTIVGGLTYQGTWNASTNTPTLASGVGTNGYYYIVSTAGSTNLDGITDWQIGDWLLFNGTVWQKIDQTDVITAIASADASVTVTTTGSSVDLAVQTSPRLIAQVRNETGSTLTKGTVVYINGASGNKATVAKALATSDATSAQTFGLVRADISNNQNGYVILAGELDGLDTSAIAAGTQLYLSSSTAGAYTTTKQYAPNHLVYVGVVTRSHATQGVIEVRIQNGYEMDELHNVSAQSPTNGQVLIYNESTSLWEKHTLTDGTGISITEGAGSITITNSAPDQTVSLTGAGTTSISGTYPSFTITSNDQYVGTVTSVGGTGTVNGITLTGTVTSSGNLTLGGTLSGVSLTTQVTGTLPIANGGTGQTTANTAFNALAPSQTSNSGKFLTTDGTNTSWAAAGSTISNDTSTSTNVYPLFASATSGSATTVYTSNAKYLYKPSTGELSVTVPRASNGIVVNSQTISENYTIASGDNGGSFGPVSVASGVTVTVSSGSVWTVV